jgi:glutamine amidotransferase
VTVAILKYNAGNVFSVLCALERLGVTGVVTDDPATLQAASHVIVPGVGEANTAMQHLRARGLDSVIRELTAPVLGICLGLQLFCSASEENSAECLGIFPNTVKRFVQARKIPHMGWNTLSEVRGPLFAGIEAGAAVYFVHSYYATVSDATISVTEYGETFSAALSRDNFHAVQFHPEKSASIGQRILENFLNHD